MQHAIQTAVVGVGGYAGAELARLLLRHPRLQGKAPVFLSREDARPTPLTEVHPHLADNNGTAALSVVPFAWERLSQAGVALLFLATPHEQSRGLARRALQAGMRVIDLSGAWRLQEAHNRAVYRFPDEHDVEAAEIQKKSVYGLPELHRAAIAEAALVANPGCYATSAILALKPFVAAGWVDTRRGIVCDAKSGVSGAGKTPTAKTHFMHAAENLSAYALFGHRHLGELVEQIGIDGGDIIFTPHLLPVPRGILSTVYVTFTETHTREEVEARLREFYAGSPLVRVFPAGRLPELQHSVRTAYADIGFELAPDGRRCILISCLDNLMKGAASQAVQNMNVMYGWPEAEGLL
jgi:N-acetyl-gamma-glutamyl-phosphate reductase